MEGYWAYLWRTSFNRSWLVVAFFVVLVHTIGMIAATLMAIHTALGMLAILLAFIFGWNWTALKSKLFGDVEVDDESA